MHTLHNAPFSPTLVRQVARSRSTRAHYGRLDARQGDQLHARSGAQPRPAAATHDLHGSGLDERHGRVLHLDELEELARLIQVASLAGQINIAITPCPGELSPPCAPLRAELAVPPSEH